MDSHENASESNKSVKTGKDQGGSLTVFIKGNGCVNSKNVDACITTNTLRYAEFKRITAGVKCSNAARNSKKSLVAGQVKWHARRKKKRMYL